MARYQIIRMANRNGERQQQHYDTSAHRWVWSADRWDGTFDDTADGARAVAGELARRHRPNRSTSMPKLHVID